MRCLWSASTLATFVKIQESFAPRDYECLPGCDCLPGFSRDKSGRCVESTSCRVSVTPIIPQVQTSDFGDRDMIVEESGRRCTWNACNRDL
ncbi:hypothetical protein CEXT_780851 [Caerostris extrusa]|uniref:TIL domain-containing protein n=1 Tax=Caerostris extrusa TaxID=172846 RepID=A0AAV4XE19_CAEEX|nr:hypothetical protein CEXT_780851 [Caerostris extrusa]